MNNRATWIVLILFALAAGLLWFLSRPDASGPAAEASPVLAAEPLFGDSPAVLTRIRVEAADGAAVEMARDGNSQWVMAAPAEGPADQGQVESAATQIVSLRVLTRVQIGAGAVGLDKPAYTLSVTFSDGSTETVRIGNATITGSGYYVQTKDGRIAIVSRLSLEPVLGLIGNPPYAP